MFPEPTKEQKEAYVKYDKMIEAIVSLIHRSFNRDDLSILPMVLHGAHRQNIDRIDEIIIQLNKIRRVLIQSESNLEAVEQTTLLS